MTEEKTRENERIRLLLAFFCLAVSMVLVVLGSVSFSMEETGPSADDFQLEPEESVREEEIENVMAQEDAESVPEPEYAAVVVIDAGHGGESTGTYSWGKTISEKTVNLKVTQYLKELTDSSENQKLKVYYTRTGDEYVSLEQRLALTQEVSADFFISIHCNGDTSRSTCGIETLYTGKDFGRKKGKNQTGTASALDGLTSRCMAEICQEELTKAIGLEDRGIMERRDLYLLHHTKIPGVIVELGFMSNPKDMSVLKKSKYQKKAAQAIYDSMIRMSQCDGSD